MNGTPFSRYLLFSLFLLLPLPLVADSPQTFQDFSSARSTVYTVKKGDCLWKISKQLYKDPYKWPLLYQHNKSLLQNPDKIEIGMKLTVPLSVDAQEMKKAIQFASDYKGSAHRKQGHSVAAGSHRAMNETASTAAASAQKSASKPAEPQAPVAAKPAEQTAPLTSSAAEKSETNSSSNGLIFVILGLLAVGGIGWWKFKPMKKTDQQEPYRIPVGHSVLSEPPVAKVPEVKPATPPVEAKPPVSVPPAASPGSSGGWKEASIQNVSSTQPMTPPSEPVAQAPSVVSKPETQVVQPPPTPESSGSTPSSGPLEPKSGDDHHQDVA